MNLLTAEGRVLAYFSVNPTATIRACSHATGLTERSVTRVSKTLVANRLMRVRSLGRGSQRTITAPLAVTDALLDIERPATLKAVSA